MSTNPYGLDFGETLDWAALVDRAAETGCVDEMLELQGLLSIEATDRAFRALAAGEHPPADFAALVQVALAEARAGTAA